MLARPGLLCRLGYEARDDCDDGVWFVDLAAVRASGRTSRPAIANASRLRERADRSADRCRRPTRSFGRKSLLLLDNCEHVVSAARSGESTRS